MLRRCNACNEFDKYLLKTTNPDTEFDKPVADIFLERMIDQYNQTALQSLQTSHKMEVFRQIKQQPGTEKYLNEVKICKHRMALTRLRLSAHNLEIETGRYNRTKPEERLCLHCKNNGKTEIEDEKHFLIRCPQYEKLRINLLPSDILNNNLLNDEQKMFKIMTHSKCQPSLAKFVYKALEDRKEYFEVFQTVQNVIQLVVEKAIPSSNNKMIYRSENSNISCHRPYEIINSCKNGMKVTLAKVRN